MSLVSSWLVRVFVVFFLFLGLPVQAGEVADWITFVTNGRVSEAQASQIEYAVYVNAVKQKLDPLVLFQLIGVESSYNRRVVSNKDARGLTQVVRRYHREKTRNRDLFDIATNVAIGALILREYTDQYGDIEHGLQAYYGDHKSMKYTRKVLSYPVPKHLVKIPESLLPAEENPVEIPEPIADNTIAIKMPTMVQEAENIKVQPFSNEVKEVKYCNVALSDNDRRLACD